MADKRSSRFLAALRHAPMSDLEPTGAGAFEPLQVQVPPRQEKKGANRFLGCSCAHLAGNSEAQDSQTAIEYSRSDMILGPSRRRRFGTGMSRIMVVLCTVLAVASVGGAGPGMGVASPTASLQTATSRDVSAAGPLLKVTLSERSDLRGRSRKIAVITCVPLGRDPRDKASAFASPQTMDPSTCAFFSRSRAFWKASRLRY